MQLPFPPVLFTDQHALFAKVARPPCNLP
ncbi:hypothetical protein J2T26_001676 [Citrobacter farmeri]|nr:hypothetical protein [Citrobacter farmeri]MCW2421918.1 hypothetical protein [Citrobacter farmeri]